MGDFSRESMLDIFIYEMNQLLEQLEQLIINCETGYSMENINEIFRIMHTIKGSSAMMMYENMSKIAHSIEDLFFFLRESCPNNVNYSTLTDIVLEGMDFIKSELNKISNEEDLGEEPVEIIEKIRHFLVILKDENQNIEDKSINLSLEYQTYKCKAYFVDNCEMINIRAFTVINNLCNFGKVLKTNPEDLFSQDAEEFIKNSGFEFIFLTDLSYNELTEKIQDSLYLKSFELKNQKANFYKALIYFQDGCEMENVRALNVFNSLKETCQDITTIPSELLDEKSIKYIKDNGFTINFSTIQSYDEIKNELLKIIYLKSLKLEKIEEVFENKKEVAFEESQKIKQSPKKKEIKKATNTQQMISVSINKLDYLLNLMGELVIAEAMTIQNPDLKGLELENFNKSARQLRKIIKEVQDTVMSMRMVSLSTTFFKMNRIVRDMCKSLGKNIELVIEGEDTEVDKNVIEHISDPLMHIIRNSADHGIETPQVRIKNGKEEKGIIKLEAKNSGREVLIIVKDDGAGINKHKVMDKAKAAKILTKPEEDYTDKEIYQLIFHPGLSTKETVTNYSGRGVGMDAVTSNIEAIGGSIIVESEEGYGTTTILKIPLTLSIIEGMLITMGGANYTIPISSIQEIFKAKKEDVFKDPDGNEVIIVRGKVYNVVRLYEFFDIKTSIRDIEKGIFIIIENEDKSLCLFVDELIGEQQVVVKPIPKYVKKVKGISGCTLLGNGDISLIIDTTGFFDS